MQLDVSYQCNSPEWFPLFREPSLAQITLFCPRSVFNYKRMNVSLDYISVGVNRVVNALAWGEHGGVAYAAHHMVALYDVEVRFIYHMYRKHITVHLRSG